MRCWQAPLRRRWQKRTIAACRRLGWVHRLMIGPQVRLAIRNAMKHADSVRHRIIRRAGEIVTAADVLTDEMQDLGMDSREAMSSAALTAGWRFWGG